MVELPLWIKPYRTAGALNSLVAPTRFVDEYVFQTKQNALGIVLEAAGMDDETLADETLEARLGRIRAAFAAFGEHWRIYQYAIRQTDATVAVSDSYPDAIVRDTVRRRAAFLENEALLATIRLVYVLLQEPPASNAGESYSQKRILRVLTDELAYNTAIALNSARSFVDQIGDLLGLRMLDKREAFAFFRLLVNLDPEIASAESLRHDEHVDFFLPSLPIERTYQRGRVSSIAVGDADLAVLTVREYPRETFPRILRDVLRIDGNFILASEFKRVSTEAAVKAIRTAERHHFWSQWDFLSLVKSRGKRDDIIVDKAEANDVEELGDLLTRVKNDGEYLGEFSITVVLYGWGGLQPLRRAAVEFQKVFGDHEGSAVQETYNALNAYLAIIPGNQQFNKRRNWLLSGNYADVSFLYAPSVGNRRNAHLRDEYLIALETSDHTPYYFNLHEEDRFGPLVLGSPGSGKSVLMNAAIDHSRKYSPLTFILDIGGSYRELTRKHGGAYLNMRFGADQTFRINPFSLASTEENLQFLHTFLTLLLGQYERSPTEDAELFDAIRGMYVLDEARRNLSNLALGLPRGLSAALRPWLRGGQFGTVFDNSVDTLSLATFQTFDFQGLDELYEPVMEPLLFYILQRISQLVYDPARLATSKQLYADEIWKFLANDRAREFLRAAGLTWRKWNGGIALITQSAESLRDAGMLGIINEICPQKLLLASPGADIAEYARMFKLNTREMELFMALRPKRQFLLKTAHGSKVLNLTLDPVAFREYANAISLLNESAA